MRALIIRFNILYATELYDRSYIFQRIIVEWQILLRFFFFSLIYYTLFLLFVHTLLHKFRDTRLYNGLYVFSTFMVCLINWFPVYWYRLYTSIPILYILWDKKVYKLIRFSIYLRHGLKQCGKDSQAYFRYLYTYQICPRRIIHTKISKVLHII